MLVQQLRVEDPSRLFLCPFIFKLIGMEFSRFSLLGSIGTPLNSWLQQAAAGFAGVVGEMQLRPLVFPLAPHGAHFKNASLARFNHSSCILRLKGDAMAVGVEMKKKEGGDGEYERNNERFITGRQRELAVALSAYYQLNLSR